jgi:translation initiation factor IF-3
MIDDHDYQVKMRNAIRFLEEGNKVKVTMRFRGRELSHIELGTQLLDKMRKELAALGKVELEPRLEGRQMIMILGPDMAAAK